MPHRLLARLCAGCSFGACGGRAGGGGSGSRHGGAVDRATGRWHLRTALGRTVSFTYGNPGDVSFTGDRDGDGVDTPGLYLPSDGFVYLRNSSSTGIAYVEFFFGDPGDVPLAGDFDGDGCETVSLYGPHEARAYVVNGIGRGAAGLGVADLAFSLADASLWRLGMLIQRGTRAAAACGRTHQVSFYIG